jgi:hypothetical protein
VIPLSSILKASCLCLIIFERRWDSIKFNSNILVEVHVVFSLVLLYIPSLSTVRWSDSCWYSNRLGQYTFSF